MCMNVRVYMHNKSLHEKDSLLVQNKSSMVRDPYLVKAPSTQDVTILCLRKWKSWSIITVKYDPPAGSRWRGMSNGEPYLRL